MPCRTAFVGILCRTLCRISTAATLCLSGARPSGRFNVTAPKSAGRCSDSPALLVVKRRKRRAPCERFTKCRCSANSLTPKYPVVRPFSKELRHSVSTKNDDKVGKESFGTSSRQRVRKIGQASLTPVVIRSRVQAKQPGCEEAPAALFSLSRRGATGGLLH